MWGRRGEGECVVGGGGVNGGAGRELAGEQGAAEWVEEVALDGALEGAGTVGGVVAVVCDELDG